MGRRGGAGEVVDLIDLELERINHVVPHEFEPRMRQQMGDVVLAAGEQVVETDDLMAVAQQPVAEMAAEKTGTAGDEDAHDQKGRKSRVESRRKSAYRLRRELAAEVGRVFRNAPSAVVASVS